MIAAQYSYTRLVFRSSNSIWMNSNNNGYSSNVLNNFTLIGVAALTGFAEYNELNEVFKSEAQKWNDAEGGLAGGISTCSSGGDSGCSSGGDSGCGGCGGGD